MVRTPKHQLVLGRLEQLLAGAEPGTPLPTERELASRFETSRTTVRQALAALTAEGRIERTQGKGTYVADPKKVFVRQLTSYSEDLRAQGLNPSSRILSVTKARPTPSVVTTLEVTPRDSVYRVERIRYVGDEPLVVEIAHLKGDFPQLRRNLERDGSLYRTLETVYDVRLTKVEDVIEAALASHTEARLLGLDATVPVLVTSRTAWSRGTPIEFTRSVFRGDRFRFVTSSTKNDPLW